MMPAMEPPPPGFATYRVLSSSIGADWVTNKRARLYTVRAPSGAIGSLIPHAGSYQFHPQLDLFFANPRRLSPAEARLSPLQRRKYLGELRGAIREARAAEILTRRQPGARSDAPFATDAGQTTRRSKHAATFSSLYGRPPRDVADAAQLTGIPKRILDDVYARGMAAWQTGHRPGASQHAWAMARVQSFAVGGPTAHSADADLSRKIRRNPNVLTGSVREMPQGGLGVMSWDVEGGRRKQVWIPAPAGVADWRLDLADPPRRLRQPEGLRASPLAERRDGATISQAVTPSGSSVWVAWQVVDLSQLRVSHDPWTLEPRADYPQTLQPRDRSRKSYNDQIGRLVATFNPQVLTWSATISDGAPIVGPDGVVESGNGRTMALSRIYRAGGEKAEQYRVTVRQWAKELGIPMPKVPHPVLVRVRQTDVDRAEFARLANVAAMQQMSAGEQAVADAAQMTADLVLQIIPEKGIGTTANAHFVDLFIAQVAGKGARGLLIDEKGRLSKTGETRIDLALFAWAYGVEAQVLINELGEVRESELRTALSGMLEATLLLARLRAGIATGVYHKSLDPAPSVCELALWIRTAKLAGQTIDEKLAQRDMLGELSPIGRLWLEALRPSKRLSAKSFGEAILACCLWVELYPAGQVSMFDEGPPELIDLVERAVRRGPPAGR